METWDLSKRYLWSFVGTPAKTGICRVLALTNQKWDTMGIKQGYCGDQYHQQYNNIYIYVVLSCSVQKAGIYWSNIAILTNHGILMGRMFFCSDKPVYLSWNM